VAVAITAITYFDGHQIAFPEFLSWELTDCNIGISFWHLHEALMGVIKVNKKLGYILLSETRVTGTN